MEGWTDDEESMLVYHSVLMSILFATHADLEVNAKMDPMTGFLISANMDSSGHLKSLVSIGSLCSALVYIMRLIAINELLIGRSNSTEGPLVK